MDEQLQSTLLKVALVVVGAVVVLVVSRLRGVSWRDDLGFRAPGWSAAALWLALWIAWMAVGEFAIRAFGIQQPEPWPEYRPLVLFLRIAMIGVLGPFAEEVVMRGAFLHRLRRGGLGPLPSIVIAAVVWAVLHYQYEAGLIAIIAADGVVLGLARHYGRSLWLPIAMHTIGNLFSIYQSMAG